jgi:hypothetical protein
MPATTNCEEAMNRHINDNTPRRNSFWRSMFCIAGMMFQKTQLFRFHALHNFHNAVKRARQRARQVPASVMMAECQFFQASPHSCNCTETRLQSKMFRMNLPCIHQFAMRFQAGITTKPVLPDTVDLKIQKSIDHLQFRKTILRRDGAVPDEQHVKGLKEFARRTIKRFSHTRQKEKLKQYVEEHFVIGDTFALGIPMSVLELISSGIREFSKKNHKIC